MYLCNIFYCATYCAVLVAPFSSRKNIYITKTTVRVCVVSLSRSRSGKRLEMFFSFVSPLKQAVCTTFSTQDKVHVLANMDAFSLYEAAVFEVRNMPLTLCVCVWGGGVNNLVRRYGGWKVGVDNNQQGPPPTSSKLIAWLIKETCLQDIQ